MRLRALMVDQLSIQFHCFDKAFIGSGRLFHKIQHFNGSLFRQPNDPFLINDRICFLMCGLHNKLIRSHPGAVSGIGYAVDLRL